MLTVTRLQDLPAFPTPFILTIGNFDGVHLGHQGLLDCIKTEAQQRRFKWAIFSFSNHPSHVLRPNQPKSLLCTPSQKIELLSHFAPDVLIFPPFTEALSKLTAEAFLGQTKNHLPFQKLILGYDATIGKDREGNEDRVRRFAQTRAFEVQYLAPICHEGTPVSSSRIRQCIVQGKLDEAARMLGRRYALSGTVIQGASRGKKLGYPTANLQVDNLCLPPRGVYAMEAILQGQRYRAIANLGVAPTFGDKEQTLLEIHIPHLEKELHGQEMEAEFLFFIRPERRFPSAEALQAQIAQDLATAGF